MKLKAYLNRRGVYYLVSVLVLAALLILGTVFLAPVIADFAKDPKSLQRYIEGFGVWGRFVFVGIQILQVVFAVIPGEVIELGAGYVYGPWEGALLCLAGAALASTGIFLLVRRLGRRVVFMVANSKKLEKFKFLHNEQQLTLIVFLLFFIPGTPKDLLTYFVGLTRIKALHFILITTFARIPSVLSSTYAGATLSEQNYLLTAVIFGVTLAVSAVGALVYRALLKRKQKAAA